MTTEAATFMPIQLPAQGPGYRKVVIVDQVRSGQPRPYADTEDVDRITIRHYDYEGNLSDVAAECAQAVLEGVTDWDPVEAADDHNDHVIAEALRERCPLPFKASRAVGEQLSKNRWIDGSRDYDIRNPQSMSEHFDTYVDKVEMVGPYTVEITVITPFTD